MSTAAVKKQPDAPKEGAEQKPTAPEESTAQTPAEPPKVDGPVDEAQVAQPKTLTDEEIWEAAVLYGKVEHNVNDLEAIVKNLKDEELPAIAAMVGRKLVGIQQLKDGTIGLVFHHEMMPMEDCTIWIQSEPLGGPGFAAITTTPKNKE